MEQTKNIVEESKPEALERRPEARAFKIEDLLVEVRQGRVRIPHFQRPLKWKRDDALKLVDSIYRGYPVGTLLFWETSADNVEEVYFGTLKITAASRTDALWVVDGQQRIVSLARILLADTPDGDEFALYFDLDKEDFSPPPSKTERDADPSRWVPLTEILDSEKLMNWLLDHASTEGRERRDTAIKLGKRIREYEVPAYLVKTNKEQILREVFGRINASGKKLQADEVFDALHGARSHSRPATLKEIATELESLEFGHLEEEKVIYRLLRVILGHDITKGQATTPLRLSESEAGRAYTETAHAAKLAVYFIMNDAAVPHYELLPYKQPLVTLGKFFHHHPEPKHRSRDLLARWLWRGALSGAHRGDTASARITLERIDPNNEEDSVQRLLAHLDNKHPPLPDIKEHFSFRYAKSKLQTLALLSLEPRNLETGKKVTPKDLQSEQGSDHSLHIPQIFTSPKGDPTLFQSIVNRIFHPNIKGLRRTLLNITDQKILISHGITQKAFDALKDGNAQEFLNLRAEYLESRFKDFFLSKARWNEPDRPSLSSLIITDGDA